MFFAQPVRGFSRSALNFSTHESWHHRLSDLPGLRAGVSLHAAKHGGRGAVPTLRAQRIACAIRHSGASGRRRAGAAARGSSAAYAKRDGTHDTAAAICAATTRMADAGASACRTRRSHDFAALAGAHADISAATCRGIYHATASAHFVVEIRLHLVGVCGRLRCGCLAVVGSCQ